MNEIPIIKYLPEKYQGLALFIVAAMAWGGPYLTRIYHALATNGGLRGAWNSIWFGTNVPPSVASDIQNIGAAVNSINQQGPDPSAVLTVNNAGNKPAL
jgi:hypothetical protein